MNIVKKIQLKIFYSREKSLYIAWACFRNANKIACVTSEDLGKTWLPFINLFDIMAIVPKLPNMCRRRRCSRFTETNCVPLPRKLQKSKRNK